MYTAKMSNFKSEAKIKFTVWREEKITTNYKNLDIIHIFFFSEKN